MAGGGVVVTPLRASRNSRTAGQYRLLPNSESLGGNSWRFSNSRIAIRPICLQFDEASPHRKRISGSRTPREALTGYTFTRGDCSILRIFRYRHAALFSAAHYERN